MAYLDFDTRLDTYVNEKVKIYKFQDIPQTAQTILPTGNT